MSREDGHGPLVAFTSLAIAGAGTVALSAWRPGEQAPPVVRMWIGPSLLVAGLIVSTWHLGRRERAHLAIRGLFRSPVSIEGALGILTVAAASLVAVGLAGAQFDGAMSAIAGALAVAFLASVGWVYRLRGQETWTGSSAATPLTAGLVFGAILLDGTGSPPSLSTATPAFVAADALAFALRWRRVHRVALDHAPSLPLAFHHRHGWMAVRLLLLDLLPAAILLVWPTPLAAVAAAGGLVLDRLGFYRLALQHRTEVEIRRVEAALDA